MASLSLEIPVGGYVGAALEKQKGLRLVDDVAALLLGDGGLGTEWSRCSCSAHWYLGNPPCPKLKFR